MIQRPVRTIPAHIVDVLRTIAPTDAVGLAALRAFGENFDADALTALRRVSADDFDHTSQGCRYHYRHPDGSGIEMVRRAMIASIVRIDLNRRRVRKESDVLEQILGSISRDAYWLGKLSDNITPHLHRHSGPVVLMTYEGEPVNQFNLPLDWRTQAETILAGLAEANCSHNDIKADNLVVADGKLKLIDFGFSTEIGAPIPDHWPKTLGEDHRLAVGEFDDRTAIFEALGRIEAQIRAALEPPTPPAPPARLRR